MTHEEEDRLTLETMENYLAAIVANELRRAGVGNLSDNETSSRLEATRNSMLKMLDGEF